MLQVAKELPCEAVGGDAIYGIRNYVIEGPGQNVGTLSAGWDFKDHLDVTALQPESGAASPHF